MSSNKYILIVNAGSATLKFKLYDLKLKVVEAGIIERIGLSHSFINWQTQPSVDKQTSVFKKIKNHQQAIRWLINYLKKNDYQLFAIGHRVVHGGEKFIKPILINRQIIRELSQFNKLAPLHNPVNLACLNFCLKKLPGIKNIAVFDTAFYQTIPEHVYRYGLPEKYYQKYSIRRYGFHGISHQYVMTQTAKKLKKDLKKINLITCHLGSGCSITAIKNGQAIDTSMGFTPLSGLLMSTRTGDLDANIPLWMINELKMSVKKVKALLNKQSGLLGLTGFKDMRDILSATGQSVKNFKPAKKYNRQDKKIAQLAIKMFVYRCQQYISAYLGILGKVDAVTFTAGIGEHSPIIQKMIMKDIKWPGRLKTLVVPTDEELMIAREIVAGNK